MPRLDPYARSIEAVVVQRFGAWVFVDPLSSTPNEPGGVDRRIAMLRALNAVVRYVRFLPSLVVLVASCTVPARAQTCGEQWLQGGAFTDVNGWVFATSMWDPDGIGPMTPKLVVGGRFTVAGNVPANRIAIFDPDTGMWSSLGSGVGGGYLDPSVTALAVLPNGDLIAGGWFITAGGLSANRIARWDGTSWSPLGSGLNAVVNTLKVLPNGDLIAGGNFTAAGGVAANNIARWDGTMWSPIAEGMNVGVFALAVLHNGDLIAGGEFGTAGGKLVYGVARWDGSSWSPLGSGMDSGVYALAVLPNGDLIAGGIFTTAGGVAAKCIARWNGSSWSPIGSGLNDGINDSYVDALAVLSNGDLIAGGNFTMAGNVTVDNIARWNGTSWSPLGSGIGGAYPYVRALAALPNDDLAAGGLFTTAGGTTSAYFARYSFTGTPTLSLQPEPQVIAADETLLLTATPTAGYSNISVQWRRNGTNIHDGQHGASSGGGAVTGAAHAMESPTNGVPAQLMLTGARPGDSGEYAAVFYNACGEVVSHTATVDVGLCPADFDHNGFVNGNDYDAFAELFDVADPGADFNHDGFINGNDYDEFADHFDVGC
ncbi:MAG: hypothetical protein U0638_14095 [Phycisphaerales bacterium]